MEGFKEFTGKSLDDAIREACTYYDASRERLEIDIVQDAKSGIFGLVGARKAIVRARRVQLRDAVEDILGRNKKTPQNDAKSASTAVKAESTTASHSAAEPKRAVAEQKQAVKKDAKQHPAPSHAEKAEARDAEEASQESKKAVKKGVRGGDKESRSALSEEDGGNSRRDRQQKPRREQNRKGDGRDARNTRPGGRQDRNGNRYDRDGNKLERDGNRLDYEGNRFDAEGSHTEPNGNRAPRAERGERSDRGERAEGREGRAPRHEAKGGREAREAREARRGQQKRTPKPAPTEHMDSMSFTDDGDDVENVRNIPLEELDQARLSAVTLEAVGLLTRSIVGEVPLEMKLHEGRVHVHLDCEENSGLLIGREGQTLAALQYITSRIVSRHMDAAVRVQLDAGDYRSRQDEKLSELAAVLAERVRTTGKPHSTRPLSSYHRRIVHVVLQESTDLVTRSSGEGPLKRVIIQRKRS